MNPSARRNDTVSRRAPAAAAPAYKILDRIKVPDGSYDYTTFDPATGRVYMARDTSTTVIETRSGKVWTLASATHGHMAIAIPGTTLVALPEGMGLADAGGHRDRDKVTANISVGQRGRSRRRGLRSLFQARLCHDPQRWHRRRDRPDCAEGRGPGDGGRGARISRLQRQGQDLRQCHDRARDRGDRYRDASGDGALSASRAARATSGLAYAGAIEPPDFVLPQQHGQGDRCR